MKAVHLFVFGIMLTLSACMWGTPNKQKANITTDTLTYTYYPLKNRADDCGQKPDSACTIVKVKFPAFNNQPALNDTVTHKLLSLFSPDKESYADFPQYIKHFFDNYYDFKRHNTGREMVFTSDSQAKIIRQDSSLTTLEISGYVFQGGAHGSSVTTFINWNTKSKKNLTLRDILTDGYKDKLTVVAEKIFRKEEKLSDTASLAHDYFFKNNKFALNDNFLITPLGIRFLYNQYEIKPYAAGQTDLFIPYAKIKTLLKPNTVITQYLK